MDMEKELALPKHTLSIYVANKPGVLVRVAMVFARRGFNIESLVVSPGQDPRFSRMTVVCRGDQDTLEQIIKQVSKLVDVQHARDHNDELTINRELALVKITALPEKRTAILQIVSHFKGQTVDLGPNAIIVQLAGNTEKLDAAIDLFREFGIIEEVRSGKMLMARGPEET